MAYIKPFSDQHSIVSYEEPVNRAAVVEVESLEPGHLSLRDSSAAKESLRDDGFS